MFETSFLLASKALLLNILIPLIPGLIFVWLFFGNKFKGIILCLLSWFVGVGVVAFSMFNLQFVHFGIGIGEYFLLLILLIVALGIKLYIKKGLIKDYISTLRFVVPVFEIKNSYQSLSKIERIFLLGGGILALGTLIISFLHTINLPTYADDSFGNRNGPAINIYHDGGVKMFGDKSEILGRGRLGYPIHIPIYKALISQFIGGFNDIYINLRQWLVFLGLFLFVIKITWDKTKNVFYSVLPIALICGLPLIYFHSIEGYMELPCAVYSVLTIWALWKFLEEKDYDYIILGLLIGGILSFIKNEGLIIYFGSILVVFVVLMFKKGMSDLIDFFKKTINLIYSAFILLWFFVPFLLIKVIYHMGFNQASSVDGSINIGSQIHNEIFPVFPHIFFKMDNYNIVLVILTIFMLFIIKKQKKNINYLIFLSPVLMIILFILMFWLTDNYVFVTNQTTVNRLFSMCFLILIAFIGYAFSVHEHIEE